MMGTQIDPSHSDLLSDLLKNVSRSFYLTLRVLPRAVRSQIGLAYLLARATDTIADTGAIPPSQRLKALQQFREKIQRNTREPLALGEITANQSLPAEKRLLERVNEAWDLLTAFDAADQERIREVLVTITSGQELDLQRFAGSNTSSLTALEIDSELDDYTYRVAGCVGEFWTKICRVHLFPKASIDEAALLRDGIRFGKGLQLVNILRDLPADLRNGRCYIPVTKLAPLGLAPSDLLEPAKEPRFRPLYQSYLDRAEEHLVAGWAYTNMLPYSQVRVRLACAWPLLIGIRTIGHLRSANILDAGVRVKVTRKEVQNIMLRSIFYYPAPGLWKNLFSVTRH